MAIPILMPKLSFVVTQGTIIEWLKEPGDSIAKGEALLTVESEKAVVDVEAPGSGILGPELAPPGTTVPVTTIIGYILQAGEKAPRLEIEGAASGTGQTGGEPSEGGTEREAEPVPGERVKASPSAKRLAREFGIDLALIDGTGPGGRIVQEDVEAHVSRQAEAQQSQEDRVRVSPVARRIAGELGIDLGRIAGSGPRGRITKEDVERAAVAAEDKASAPEPSLLPAGRTVDTMELSTIQRIAAERMALSFRTAPHFYLSVQVDMSRAVELREALLSSVEAKHGVRLSYTDLLVCAVGRALASHPILNASFAGDKLARYAEINPCLAVDTPQGLTVPVFRRADQLSLAEIALRRATVVEKAQGNRLALEDLSDGTFTISNLGMFGIDLFQAIINPPQAAILAAGRIAKRPVVVDDTLALRPTVWLTLSVDHRVADGATAARFLQTLTGYLEDPYRMLM